MVFAVRIREVYKVRVCHLGLSVLPVADRLVHQDTVDMLAISVVFRRIVLAYRQS